MGSLQMRRKENYNSADLLPDYKRHKASAKQQTHLVRNAAALAGLCLVVFLFVRSSTLTASLGISSPTKGPKGPRGFTSAAGFEATARHKQHLEQHDKDADDGSIVVDTTHGAHTADSIKPAQAMDQHSLQGDHAPKFVGGDLVDPAEPANTAAKAAQHGINAATLDKTRPHGVYSMTAVDIDGHPMELQEFAGKVTIFVNVASKCGYTDANYKGLQKLYEKYQSSGLEVLAFPCNQFGNQEPGTDAEIEVFATGHYHTTFPMFSKIDVNGPSTHPVYKYLKEQLHIQDPPGLEWNFQKILVNRAGKPVLLLQQDWDQGRVEHAVYNLLVSGSAQ